MRLFARGAWGLLGFESAVCTKGRDDMRTWSSDVGLTLRPGDELELRVIDLSLSRALYEGIPTARLLARMRLGSDERDLDATPLRKTATSSWDALLARILGGAPNAAERVKRAIARHARAAFDEGGLPMEESCAAALAFALAVSDDPDASPSEVFGEAPRGDGDRVVARACGAYEPRLGSAITDKRAILFEACARMTTRAVAGPWPAERARDALMELASPELGATLRRSNTALFPLAFDADIALAERRMVLLERAELDALLAKDPRELASAIARSEREHGAKSKRSGAQGAAPPPSGQKLDTLLADLTVLLERAGELVIAVRGPEPDDEKPMPSVRPSWGPTDWSSAPSASALGDAVERGAITIPRLRGLVARGGEPALDAIGAEMLRVTAHPFASAAFADLLARSGRPRDVMRLVTYFAVAPDPTTAARALSACGAPELPSVLRAWLEAMLPSDGGVAPFGENPETSSAARLTACVASLRPYPRLYGAVRPLLARVSEAPPQSSDGPAA
jgi:hypothetical protein